MRSVTKRMRVVTIALSMIMAAAMLGQVPIIALGEGGFEEATQVQAALVPYDEDEPSFQLTVSIPEGGATFFLPTSSCMNGSMGVKEYDWAIDWGDGDTELASGTNTNRNGIPHTYEYAGYYTVTITPNGTTEAWLAAFGFTNSILGSDEPANKDLVIAAAGPLTPQMTRTSAQIDRTAQAPRYEWAYMFSGCTNLVQGPSVLGWDQIYNVGSAFASFMFNECSSLEYLPEGFNLPQRVTMADDGFARGMFYLCYSLKCLPEGFNFPQGITHDDGSFAYGMFYTCESLSELPAGFNLPQGITSVGSGFAAGLFSRCYSLESLPEGFNLPPGITSTGNEFASYMLNYCTNLDSLPAGFNLPQGIVSVGWGFVMGMFIACESLDSLPAGFNLPQGISYADSHFAAEMFRDAGSASFQLNDELCFPIGVSADTSNAFYRAFQLSELAPVQDRTAASIIGDCPTPADRRETFGSCFADLALIPLNWGGPDPALTEQMFSFIVRVTSAPGVFVLPTSGYQNGTYDGKPYDWLIDWGDGSSGVYAGTSAYMSGITHVYSVTSNYGITISSNGSTEAWLAAFGFYGADDQQSSNMIVTASGPIKPEMTRTTGQIDGSLAAPDYEWGMTFYNCLNLRSIPAFIGWEGIDTVGDYFATGMYYNCTSLSMVNTGVTLPQGITKAGDAFAYEMFSNCTRLTTLPSGFNLPQRITEVGDSFAARMFFAAGSPNFQLNDEFCFPAGIPADSSNAYYQALQLSDQAPVQHRRAIFIIGDCPTPSTPRYTFDAHFGDIEVIPVNWGGGLVQLIAGSGDLDGDGLVTMDEVIVTLQATIGVAELSAAQLAAIDMDFDGAITMADVVLVLGRTV
ncbi:MAG: hypothetical protein FWH40_04365 [Coriobacteriia bacterium]|nr:hypothetical protein [Coriobacteriia bacterium]